MLQIFSIPSHLKDLFASNAILWAAIAYIIETQKLMCSIRKIKSHSSNSNPDPAQLHNDTADQLAKAGTMKPLFSFDTSFLSDSQYILSWSAIEVDLPTRKFVKQLCEAKSFNTVYNSSRQQKLKHLSQREQINWTLTKNLLASANVDESTSRIASTDKAF